MDIRLSPGPTCIIIWLKIVHIAQKEKKIVRAFVGLGLISFYAEMCRASDAGLELHKAGSFTAPSHCNGPAPRWAILAYVGLY